MNGIQGNDGECTLRGRCAQIEHNNNTYIGHLYLEWYVLSVDLRN